jgi:hypothetical protein
MAEYILDTTDGIYNARTTGELVRCRDCAFFGRSAESDWLPWCWRDPDHSGHGWPTSEYGYCAWAERRHA